MGKRGTVVSCVASLGIFALGATLGSRCRRVRHVPPPQSPSPSSSLILPSSPDTTLSETATTMETSTEVVSSQASNACALPPSSGALKQQPTSTTTEPPDCGLLDCPVCLAELVLPRVTLCGHTLCTTCLSALGAHERRPQCPVCRRRIRTPVEKLPINFLARACVEQRVSQRGPAALATYRLAEHHARQGVHPSNAHLHLAQLGAANGGADGPAAGSSSAASNSQTPDERAVALAGGHGLAGRLRPAWNWLKWTVIIVTELGAFLVSLKEVVESAPTRSRRYQRIV